MHTIIVKNNHDVLVFGANEHGQLGLGHIDNQLEPQTLMQKIPIRQIACGYRHTVILRENNDVLVFGRNIHGQLGLGHNDGQYESQILMQGIVIRQIACGAQHTIILQENNDVLVFGYNGRGQLGLGHNDNQNKPVKLMQNVKQIEGYNVNIKWSSENHHQFSTAFRNRIHCFLLIHKRNQNSTRLKIPKFVLFEIFKKV